MEDIEFHAWLCTNVLRQHPVQLIRLGDVQAAAGAGVGGAGASITINTTYDDVNLERMPVEMHLAEPLAVGVGDDGFYTIRQESGHWVRGERIGAGKTLGSLLHAIAEAEPVERSAVLRQDVVTARLATIKRFFATDWLGLQEPLVAQHDRLWPRREDTEEGPAAEADIEITLAGPSRQATMQTGAA